MKTKNLLIFFIVLMIFLSNCSDDSNPVDPTENQPEESATVTVTSSEGGTVSTTSGISISVIGGTVPKNENGNDGTISFSIETPVEAPSALGSGGEFVGALVQYGPEGFIFNWPVEMILPYPESENPEYLYVVHYDNILEEWKIIPKSGIEVSKELIRFNAIDLGIYGLAKFSANQKMNESSEDGDADGGFVFTGNSNYDYTITVATVTAFKFPYQAAWGAANLVGAQASTGYTNSAFEQGLAHIILNQATYTFWVSRVKKEFDAIKQTYSFAASGTLEHPLLFNQSGSTTSGWNNSADWTILNLPTGGTWVDGSPDNWPTPTKTFGNGEFQATLTWVNNSSHVSDVDLHLYGPNSMHVFYDDDTSVDGLFKLDRDWISDLGNATENIYSTGSMPSGEYTVKIVLYEGDPVDVNVRVKRPGATNPRTIPKRLSTVDEEITIVTFTK